MTTRRIHLKDYTEAELREMPAGPLCDWLVAQADGYIMHDRPPYTVHLVADGGLVCMEWDVTCAKPSHFVDSILRFSAVWSAAGPLLTRMMRENGCRLAPSGPDNLDSAVEWTGFWTVPPERVVATTPELAICRAALVLARRKLDKKGEGAKTDG